MVISRDRKKILLVKKSSPAVKGINWNFLVIFLSMIMVLIGIPSMVSSCFPNSMETWGSTIFVSCVSVIVFLLGILYLYAASHRYKEVLSRYNAILNIIVLGLLLLTSLVLFITGHLAYFLISLFISFFLYIIDYFGVITPKIERRFKKLCNLCLAGLILVYLGGVIISISMLNPLLSEIYRFGLGCNFIGALLFLISSGILFSKKISSIKHSKKCI